ncbi:MAG: winged helix-turn-helix domain-containing protein [Alphaproteobacteria bacterium]|nr:winged helix-turn-helix domain-containing protein [Alphaproteobacteria bacterium]
MSAQTNGHIFSLIADPCLRDLVTEGIAGYLVAPIVSCTLTAEVLENVHERHEHLDGQAVIVADQNLLPLLDALTAEALLTPVMAVGEGAADPGAQARLSRADLFPTPFRMGRFLDRLARNLRKETAVTDRPVFMGPYTLYPLESGIVREEDGTRIALTEKERDILLKLHQQKGRPVSRDELLDDVWGYVPDLETHTLETHIYRLRQKLEPDPAGPVFLITDEDGNGYRLEI